MITDRIDAITKIDEAHYGSNIPVPRSVKIELTARCNFRCSFCASAQRLRDKQDMDFELFKRVTSEMRECGVEELGLFYLGESFLYPKLVNAIEHAKHSAKYPYVFLTTNGSIAYGSTVKSCFKAGLDSLKFSMNYSSQEQLEEIARVKGPIFHRIIDNVRAASIARYEVEAETGHRCGLYASYIQNNDEQADKMQHVIDVVSEYVVEVYALPLYYQAALVPNSNAVAGNIGRVGNLRTSIPCWSIFTEGHVTWDGKLSACCFDHDGRFEMGDLTKNSFLDCWNSMEFQKLREAHLVKDVTGTVCEQCVAWS